MGSSSTNSSLETRRGVERELQSRSSWAARAGGSADPREGTAGDWQPCPWLWQCIYSSRNTGSFKYPAPKGVAGLLCCQQQRDPCSSPPPATLREGEGLHVQFFKLSQQENKKTSPKLPKANTASVLGVPSKTSRVAPPSHGPSYEGEALLLFIAKWPFREKFGKASRSLGLGSSMGGAEASSEAGSHVSHGRGYAEGYFGTWEELGYLWHQHQPRDPRCQRRKGRSLGASAAIMHMRV